MLRREFLTTIAAAPLLAAQADAKPNIVFILADDLGYGDLGCYGQKRIATPNIDKFAAQGIRFTNAYAGDTVCAPSRCCLMTGKHTGHASVRGNMKPEPGLDPKETILPEVLKGAGYRTALFGKWGLGGPRTGSIPNLRGFDEFYGFLDQQHAHNSFPEDLWNNQDQTFLTPNWFGRRKVFVEDLFTEKATEFIGKNAKQPFFLYVAYTSPHADNERGTAEGNGIDVPSDAPYADRDWPAVEKSFAALVTRLDRDVATVMKALADAGVERNTLVIFTSDNGPHKEGNHDPDFFLSRGGLRGIKRDLYEGGIRVPFIARWPGKIRAGATSDQPLAFWDMLPTFCELTSAAAPRGIDGISVLPAILDNKRVDHPPMYWEFHENGFKQAVRWGDWKAVRTQADGPIELYDLKTDLSEQRNVAASHPSEVGVARDMFTKLRTDSAAFPVQRR